MKNKTKQPLVSVLVPVYNGSDYIQEAVDSILKSSYKNLEVLLINDGSTDASLKLCRELDQKYQQVRTFSFRKNKGMTHALNFGVKKAKGKYIARINQDDIMTVDRLKKQVTFLETNLDHVVVGGAIQLFTWDDPNYELLHFPLTDKKIRAQWMVFSPYSDPTVMYHKSAWLKTKGYDQNYWPADDVYMWYQLGLVGKLANLPDVLTLVRWHQECGSIKSHRQQILKTWEVHHWAAKNIQQPKLIEQTFWVGQLLAGYLFKPQFNWWVYWQMRKIQKQLSWLSQHPLLSAAQKTFSSFFEKLFSRPSMIISRSN